MLGSWPEVMQIHLIAVGNRMPEWVESGYQEYSKRMPPECSLHLIEVPAQKRGKGSDTTRILAQEGERMVAAIPKGALILALAVRGRVWSTEQLAEQMQGWLQAGRDVALLIGGPEGLDPGCERRADVCWSLSPLTFPHPLMRVILAEQLYRAMSILKNHPYHNK